MIRLNKKVEYAMIAILYMSEKEPSNLTTARELAETYSLSLEMIGKVLQTLAKKALIVSVQGVKGGYEIKKSLSEISISTVIEAIEGPVYLVSCMKKKEVEMACERKTICNIRSSMDIVQRQVRNFFSDITLQNLKDHNYPSSSDSGNYSEKEK